MVFKLAGQNPAVEALVYRPSDSSEVRTLELRPGMDGFNGPPTLETIGPYNPSEDTSEIIQLAASNSDPRFAAVETILPLLVGGVPGSSPYDTFNPSDYDPLLRPENQWDRYEEPSEPEGQLELPIELAGNIYTKNQQPKPEKWPSRQDPVKGLRTDWMVDPHMGVVAPFVRKV